MVTVGVGARLQKKGRRGSGRWVVPTIPGPALEVTCGDKVGGGSSLFIQLYNFA